MRQNVITPSVSPIQRYGDTGSSKSTGEPLVNGKGSTSASKAPCYALGISEAALNGEEQSN